VGQAPAARRGPRRAIRRLLTVAAAVLVGLLPAVQAHAAPSPEEIQAQIDKQWQQLEPTIEQYNKVRSELKANQKKAAQLEQKIQPLSLQADLALDRVGGVAARYYMTGPSSELNALLSTGNPNTLADQLTILDRLARQERKQIDAVVATRDRYNAQKAKLDALIAQQAKQAAELAARKTQIDAEVKRLQASLPRTIVKVENCPTVTGVVGSAAATAIRIACAQVGKPYVWGATGPNSFDCSGLTQYAYGKAGIHLTHYTGAQWSETRSVSRSEARPGDLVFFFSDRHHVGLYLGNGIMVHAANPSKPINVSKVSYMPIAGFRRPS
jgi:cell wall-associated NlpC family hydrolase